MYQKLLIYTATTFFIGSLTIATAALPPREPGDLDKAATLIISAAAAEITTSTKGALGHTDTIFIIEAKVDSVSKGSGAKVGETIKIRAWQPKRRPGGGWAGPQGIDSIPGKGASFKAWLRKDDDGVWEPLEPNGILLMEGAKNFEKPDRGVGFFRRLFGG
ncbi:MAG: hypothetical protein AAF585_21510 [Verrucomicrobiota bacterium]